jgi:hypothetical protein
VECRGGGVINRGKREREDERWHLLFSRHLSEMRQPKVAERLAHQAVSILGTFVALSGDSFTYSVETPQSKGANRAAGFMFSPLHNPSDGIGRVSSAPARVPQDMAYFALPCGHLTSYKMDSKDGAIRCKATAHSNAQIKRTNVRSFEEDTVDDGPRSKKEVKGEEVAGKFFEEH